MFNIAEKTKNNTPLIYDDYISEEIFTFEELEIGEAGGGEPNDKDKKHKKKKFIAKGRMIRGGKVTLNKTKYDAESLKSTFIPDYIKSYVNKKRGYGLDGHPGYESAKPSSASIRVKKMWMEGDDVWAEFVVLETTAGKNTQELIREGGALGISSRGGFPTWESVPIPDNKGVRVIAKESGFKFRGFDVVLDASSVGSGIMSYKEDNQLINKEKGGETMENEKIKTKEDLRIAYPTLVADIIKEEQANMLKVVDNARDTIKEDTVAGMKGREIKESVVLDKESGIVCPNCESVISKVDASTFESEITTLKEEADKGKERIEALEKENGEMKKKEEELAIKEFISESLKDKKHDVYREALVKKIGVPENKEEAKKVIESEVAFVSSLNVKGTGVSNLPGVTLESNKGDMSTLAGAGE